MKECNRSGINHGMAWYGMVCDEMVWYGMVWYVMKWYGMVCDERM